MAPFDDRKRAGKDGLVAAASWSERNVIGAQEAFRQLTGKSPLDAPDAWRVVWQALLAVGEPNAQRAAWVHECVKPFLATRGVRKAGVLPALWARKADPGNYRHALEAFDERFSALTDAVILSTFKKLWEVRAKRPPVSLHEANVQGWFAAIARVSLHVGAFDVVKRPDESEKAAIVRIGNTFRVDYDLHARTKSKLKKPRK